MKYVAGCLVLVSFFALNPVSATEPAKGVVTCECPKLACDPCSIEKGVTFFAEKCGPDKSKMKSCARPTCIPIELATRECPNPPTADSGPRAPIVVAGEGEVKREAASGSAEVIHAGKVKVLQGSVSIVQADGKTSVVTGEALLREGDRIVSGKDGGAVVDFKGGNRLHVQPDTQVEIKEYRDPASNESRKALLNLIKGKVRNEVNQKYKGKNSYYRVITRAAVAGVRGTDFLISHSEEMKMDTRIETLGGRVELANLDESESRSIGRGEAISFIADIPTGDALAIPPGKFSELHRMSAEEMKALDRDTRMDVARAKRSTASASDAAICSAPNGLFNQCMWKCEGNPKGEKTCRTDLATVRCARSRCNGNGVWAEETRLPASAGVASCPANGTLVKDCDY